jgi:pyrimidine deaminase RibD-like protein
LNVNTRIEPDELCEKLLNRSTCSVQVAAVLVDGTGIFGWGWNHMGADGFGEHAEVNALKRSNRSRIRGAALFVASRRQRNGKTITSKPCEKCQGWIEALEVGTVWWRGGDGLWRML